MRFNPLRSAQNSLILSVQHVNRLFSRIYAEDVAALRSSGSKLVLA